MGFWLWRECGRTEFLVQQLLLGALRDDRRLALVAHARTCTECRRTIVQAARLEQMLHESVLGGWEGLSHTDACPPAEVLAGFADGTLPPSVQRQWGSHIADCMSCALEVGQLQVMLGQRCLAPGALAELVREVSRGSVRQVSPVVWQRPALALAALAAAALVVWFLLPPQTGPAPVTAPVVASVPTAPSPAPEPEPPARAVAKAGPASPAPPPAASPERTGRRRPARQRRLRTLPPSAPEQTERFGPLPPPSELAQTVPGPPLGTGGQPNPYPDMGGTLSLSSNREWRARLLNVPTDLTAAGTNPMPEKTELTVTTSIIPQELAGEVDTTRGHRPGGPDTSGSEGDEAP